MGRSLTEVLNLEIFSLGVFTLYLYQIIGIAIIIVSAILIWKYLLRNSISLFLKTFGIKEVGGYNIRRIVKQLLVLIVVLSVIFLLRLDISLFNLGSLDVTVTIFVEALLILKFAHLLDWVIFKILIRQFYKKREEDKKEIFEELEEESDRDENLRYVHRLTRYLVYLLSIIFILRNYNIDLTLFPIKNGELNIDFTLSRIFSTLLIIVVAQLLVWFISKIILRHYFKRRKVEEGGQYAVNQLLKYIIYIFTFVAVLQNLGINLTLILGGSAALLVGIGLGLQQTFNDLISGVILLFDQTVEVGDVVNVGGMIGTVKKIGIRTSIVETRENVSVVVPNSSFIGEKVVNWSHFDEKVRFSLAVGIAYGSDTDLVKKLLLQVAKENIYVIKHPSPFVRFKNFGDSALDFELHFWTRNILIIEDIKSDLRFEIDKAFRAHNVEIPFPQRVVWTKKTE